MCPACLLGANTDGIHAIRELERFLFTDRKVAPVSYVIIT